jgi:stage V sporulation protein SpoVS
VRRALSAVEAARASLPPDTRALVVILADVARGGLNQAVIAIEEARGRLAEAAGTVQ